MYRQWSAVHTAHECSATGLQLTDNHSQAVQIARCQVNACGDGQPISHTFVS